MTLYKGTLEDEDVGDDEPQVEPARIPLTLKVIDKATVGLESLIDPGASHTIIWGLADVAKGEHGSNQRDS